MRIRVRVCVRVRGWFRLWVLGLGQTCNMYSAAAGSQNYDAYNYGVLAYGLCCMNSLKHYFVAVPKQAFK
jgi:hypothetical protein